MRRSLITILLFVMLAVFSTTRWVAQRAAGQEDAPVIVVDPPDEWLEPGIRVTDLTRVPDRIDAGPAADKCEDATPLELSFGHTADGGLTNTTNFSRLPSDPILQCMFGAPTNWQGYRSAWYSLTAGDTSVVTITTEGTEYDTVLGVFAGECGSLTALACSDDLRGFQSSVSFQANRGQTYYIEVADYRPGAPIVPLLKLSAVLRDGGANWTQLRTLPHGGVSRHAFAANGKDMFIIGGQTELNAPPGIAITDESYHYNAENNEFYSLPGVGVPGSSLANTTAVYLDGKIYIPGGFNGDNTEYLNKHLVYDTVEQTWTWDEEPAIPTALLPSGQMFAWAAAAAEEPAQASYFVTGGKTSVNQEPNEFDVVIPNVYRYTTATKVWSAVTPMSSARYAHTAAWVNKANRGLCVAGGLTTGVDGDGNNIVVLLTGGECYNPSVGAWQQTGTMNFPRYNAGSAVGPDGNWYVFGGLDATGGVPETEVYEPNTNAWHPLSGDYSLGGSPDDPARVWPRGAFWNGVLYVFGGNTPPPENGVISAIERMTLGAGFAPLGNRIMLPLSTNVGSDNFLTNAAPLPFNVPVSGNFVDSNQFANGYTFDWPALGCATLELTNVASNDVLKLYVYTLSKAVVARDSSLITGNKSVAVVLRPGRYFVTVEREVPGGMPNPNHVYQLTLLTGRQCIPMPLQN